MGKIQAIEKAGNFITKTFRTRTVKAESKSLFSFAQQHSFKKNGGKSLDEDGLIITHLTNYAPKDGFIDTARSAIGAPRDSVHFAVNHGVTSHTLGNWDSMNYAVLMPMRAARQTAGNKFVGGVAGDFYSHGRVRIPKGSVIVRRNSAIPKGRYKIVDSSKIDEFKELEGVKIIETSNENMKVTVDNIVRRLGYKNKNTDEAFYWGLKESKDIFQDFKLFNKYLKENDMLPAFHSYTPNGKLEMLITHIQAIEKLGLDWKFLGTNGKLACDYKKEVLKALKYIDKYTKETGLPKDFDTKILKDIIKNAKTPQEAVEMIKIRMNISGSLILPEQVESIKGLSNHKQIFFVTWQHKMLVNGKANALSDNATIKYLNKPCKKLLNSLNALDSDIGKAMIEESSSLRAKLEPVKPKIRVSKLKSFNVNPNVAKLLKNTEPKTTLINKLEK